MVNAQVSREINNVPNTLEELFDQGLNPPPMIDKILDEFVDELVKSNSDVLAFSVAFGEQLPYTIDLISRVKEKLPDTPVIMGGAQISLLDAEQIKMIQERSPLDLIFQGYAEVLKLYKNQDYKHLTFKTTFDIIEENGKSYLVDCFENKKVPLEGDLSEIVNLIYGKGLVPKYKNLLELKEEAKVSNDSLKKLVDFKILTA